MTAPTLHGYQTFWTNEKSAPSIHLLLSLAFGRYCWRSGMGVWGGVGRMQLNVGSDTPLSTLQGGGESESWVPKVTFSKVFIHKGCKKCWDCWDFPGGSVAKTPYSQCGLPGSIPDQGTRSHMPQQLRIPMQQLKIPRAASKTWHSQINMKKQISWGCWIET